MLDDSLNSHYQTKFKTMADQTPEYQDAPDDIKAIYEFVADRKQILEGNEIYKEQIQRPAPKVKKND